MDAPRAVHRVAWPHAASGVVVLLARASLTTLFVAVTLAVVLIFARRILGALVGPLPTAALLPLAVTLAAAALAFRTTFAATPFATQPAARYLVWAAPSLVLLLAAIGLLVPGTPPVGFVVVVGSLLLEEGWSWGRLFPAGAAGRGAPNTISPTPDEEATIGETRPEVGLLEEPANAPDERTVQWMRRREDDGHESIEGLTRVDFEVGQRHAIAHLAICPPLPRIPVCYAEPSSGPDAQLTVAQVLPHGVRIDVKLDQPADQPEQVIVEFSIQESPQAG